MFFASDEKVTKDFLMSRFPFYEKINLVLTLLDQCIGYRPTCLRSKDV